MGRIGDEIRLMNQKKNRTTMGTRDPAFQNILYAGWTTVQSGMNIPRPSSRNLTGDLPAVYPAKTPSILGT
jgi:hypothetical protein